MATRQRKAGGGRVTPKGGTPRASGLSAGAKGAPKKPERPVAIGRRPSSAGFLAFVAVMWMAVGVIMFLSLSSSWKLVPVIVAIGIGGLFLRGAISTVLRHERRRDTEI
jgi:hypothetical protein